ncbi:MAG: DNA-directed RNA polymerase subunit G [Sulfolobales archaeon]
MIKDLVKVKGIKKSLVPKIFIVDLEGSLVRVEMDLHQEIFEVKDGEELEFVLGSEKPEYRDGVDFCARGFIAGIKRDEKGFRVIASLWGFLVIIYPRDESISADLTPMKEIYLCLRRKTI